jgi:hypothetical protein
MAKEYATETDIIEIADALYGPGTQVFYRQGVYRVRDFAWDTLNRTWTYTLTYNGSVHYDDAPEKYVLTRKEVSKEIFG